MDEQTKTWDFFIAYARADAETAEKLYEMLANESLVFLDSRCLKLGDDWDVQIPLAQRQAHATIVLISPHTEKAYYQREEIRAAIQMARDDPSLHQVIPVFLDEISNTQFTYGIGLKEGISVPEAGGLPDVAKQLLSLLRVKNQGQSRTTRVTYAPETFEQQKLELEDEVFAIAFSSDGHWLAAASEHSAAIWDLANMSEDPLYLPHNDDYVYAIAFSLDSRWLATAGQDGRIRMWDIETQKTEWEQKEKDSRRHTDAIYSIAFSSDGNILATGSYDRHVKLWHASTGSFRQELLLTGRVGCIAHSPREPLIAIGSHDNTITIWNYRTLGRTVLGSHQSSVEDVAFSRDGLKLASGGLDKIVRLWDIGACRQLWERPGHEYLVKSVAISPDGETVASASWDKTINLWDIFGNRYQILPYSNLPWHEDWIWSVRFSPDGMILASGGSDGRIMLWRGKKID
jgi:WD40 repeat protein